MNQLSVHHGRTKQHYRTGAWRYLAIVLGLLSCPSTLLNAADKNADKGIVPGDIPALIYPEAKHIHEESLQDAMKASVRAGALFLLEEMLAPNNDSKLIYAPHAALKKTGEKVVERRYRKDRQPVYEMKKVPQLVPVRDDYGTITGYEKRMVEVRASDRIVNWRDVEVPDANGDIIRNITVPIFDRSNKMLPRGWFGMNAQGILILCRCGLDKSSQVQAAASELERLMNMFGIPDTTWDQAWLAMAWMALAESDSNRSDRRDRLIGRLIDGALISGNSKNVDLGFWGPVSINHEAQAHLFRVELELQTLFSETEAALAAAPARKRDRLSEEFQKISTALAEVKTANRHISQQGRRLSEVERPWSMDETHKTTGISYYMYNRDITDIDSTAIAAMALYEAKQRKVLPEITPRDKIQGKTLVRGVEIESVIESAYKSLFDLTDELGNFNSCTRLFPIDAYDKVPNLAGVPLAITLPTLLSPETWRSNTSGMAAIYFLDALVSDRSRERMRDRDTIIANNSKRVQDIVKLYLAKSPNDKTWASPHANENDTLKELEANNGWPTPSVTKKRAEIPSVESLAIGYLRTPRELLENLMILYKRDQDASIADTTRSIAYRLLLEQNADGSWPSSSGLRVASPGMSSGEWTYLIGKLAQRHLWQAADDQKNKVKDPLINAFLRDGPWPLRTNDKLHNSNYIYSVVFQGEGNAPRSWGYPDWSFYSANLPLAETLSALLYLSEGLDELPVIDKDEPFTILARAQAAVTDHEQALLDAQNAEVGPELTEAKRDKLIKELETTGPIMANLDKGHRTMLHEVWRQMLIDNSMQDRLVLLEEKNPEPLADAIDTGVTPTDEKDAADAKKDDGKQEDAVDEADDKPTRSLDDILGGGDK